MKREPTAEEREKIVRAIVAGGLNRSNQHAYFYHRVRFDRGTGVYQGAHHRATSVDSREVHTETTKETSFRCSPLSCARDAPSARVRRSMPVFPALTDQAILKPKLNPSLLQ